MKPEITIINVNIELKNPLKNNRVSFAQYLKKILALEMKKIKEFKLAVEIEPKKKLPRKKNEIFIQLLDKEIRIHLLGILTSKRLKNIDQVYDMLINAIDISEYAIKHISINYSRSKYLKKLSLAKFFDKTTITSLRANTKNPLNPTGIIFTTETMSKSSNEKNEQIVLAVTDEKSPTLTFISKTDLKKRIPWGIATQSDKIINNLSDGFLNTIGAKDYA